MLAEVAARHVGGRSRTVVAWASGAGVERFRQDVLVDRMDSVEIVIGANGRLTELDAVLRLREMGATIWIAYHNDIEIFHPKVYAFDGGPNPPAFSLYCGGPNVTEGGLITNTEALLGFSSPDRTQEPARSAALRFDEDWTALTDPANQYVHQITQIEDVQALYRAGLLVSTRQASRRREQDQMGRRRGEGAPPTIPVKPVARRQRRNIVPLSPPFELDAEPSREREEAASAITRPQPPVLGGTFYVRTLTDNDVAKLTQRQVGTFEPDLGETPRDQNPQFWRWPDEYIETQRAITTYEYVTTARLDTPLTGDQDVIIDLRFWHRPERPGHAAEHRITPRRGPTGDLLKDYVPSDFDTDSIMIFEEAPAEADYEYVVRLLRAQDDGYEYYRRFATTQNPRHRYGYGPAV